MKVSCLVRVIGAVKGQGEKMVRMERRGWVGSLKPHLSSFIIVPVASCACEQTGD